MEFSKPLSMGLFSENQSVWWRNNISPAQWNLLCTQIDLWFCRSRGPVLLSWEDNAKVPNQSTFHGTKVFNKVFPTHYLCLKKWQMLLPETSLQIRFSSTCLLLSGRIKSPGPWAWNPHWCLPDSMNPDSQTQFWMKPVSQVSNFTPLELHSGKQKSDNFICIEKKC